MEVNEKITIDVSSKSLKSGMLLLILAMSAFALITLQPRHSVVIDADYQNDERNPVVKLSPNFPERNGNDASLASPSIMNQHSTVNQRLFTPSSLSKLLLERERLVRDANRPRSQQFLSWERTESGEFWLPVILRARSTDLLTDLVDFINSAPIPMKVREVVEDPFPLVEILVPLSEASTAYKLFNNHPNLKYFEPEVVLRASEIKVATINDPLSQWGLDAIDAPQAWLVTTGSKEVKVAIIDSGVDLDHPDLQDNIGSLGHDWIDGDDVPDDVNGHGTHVAGIVAAVMNNSLGIAGIANITLHVERILDANGEGRPIDAIKAIENAVSSGARVITASWGSFGSSQILKEVVDWAFNQGALVVAASGNQGQQREFYPAAFPNVLSVGATDAADNRASFSNYGDWIQVVAPGVNIMSTYKGDFTTLSGTSMAAPHVAGVAALALSVQPSLSSQMLMNVLQYGTNDLGTPGKDKYHGYGLINASKVVHLLNNNLVNPLLAGLFFNISTPLLGERISGTLELYNVGVSNLTNLQLSIRLDDGTLIHQFSEISIPLNSSLKLSFEWQVPSTVKIGGHQVLIEVTDNNEQPMTVLDLSSLGGSVLHVASIPNYVVLESSPTKWIPLDGSNSQLLALDDDDARTVELPFNFSFLDINTDKIWVGSNGLLSFKEPIVDYYSYPLPVLDSSHSTMLAFAWTDLSPPSNPSMKIRTNVTLERAVIQFLSMGHYSSGILLGDVQIVLWKDGLIDVRYRNFDFSRDVGVVMGLNLGRVPVGLESVNVTWSVTWSPPTWKGDAFSIRITPLHLKPVAIIPAKKSLHVNTNQSEWLWNVNDEIRNNITHLTLYLDDNVIHDGVPPASPTFQVAHEGEGTHELALRAKDDGGREYWDNFSFIVDVTPPVMVASLPDNATSVSSSDSVLISWNAADIHSDLFVSVLLDGWPLAEGSSGSVVISYWGKPGWHDLQLLAIDSAGNLWLEARKIYSDDAQVFIDDRFRIQSAINFNGPYSAFLSHLTLNFPFSSHLELQGDNILDRYLLGQAGLLVVPHAEISPNWWQVTTLIDWGLRRGGLLVFGPSRDSNELSTLVSIHDAFVNSFSVRAISLELIDGTTPIFAKEDSIGPRLTVHPLSANINSLQWSSADPVLGYQRIPHHGSKNSNVPINVTTEHVAFFAYPSNTSQADSFEIIDLLLPIRSVNDLTRRMLFVAESTPFLDSNAYGYPESLTTKLSNNIVRWLLPKYYAENFVGVSFLRPLANETIVTSSPTSSLATIQLSSSPPLAQSVPLVVEWQAYLSAELQGMVSLSVDNSVIVVNNETMLLSRPVRHDVRLPLTEGSHALLLQLYDADSSAKLAEARLVFNLVINTSINPSTITPAASTTIIIPLSLPVELLLFSGLGIIVIISLAISVVLIRRGYLKQTLENL